MSQSFLAISLSGLALVASVAHLLELPNNAKTRYFTVQVEVPSLGDRISCQHSFCAVSAASLRAWA
jgi:hypothetical protein